jgi:membrane protein YdbS with pleckstrin-like domain
LQRRFGLASIKFFTAGGSSVDLKIAGLVAEEAERLRAFILQRSQR